MSDYFSHPELAELYLEDSFVLAVRVDHGEVAMEVDFVLREGHARYTQPGEVEQYCYQRGLLKFEGVKSASWNMPSAPPATDATGEADFGGIDEYVISDDVHRLVGEFGELTISCAKIIVDFDQ